MTEPSPRDAVRGDPLLRLALRTARAWGVAPGQFMAWPQDDRDLAMALLEWEDGLCPNCRGDLEETTPAQAEDRYLPNRPIRCHRCTAIAQAQALAENPYHPQALLFSARDTLSNGSRH